MNELQRRFRELLIESVVRHYEVYELPDTTPLLLSGGTDSTTLLFALLEAGKRPPCYTFQLGERENNDVRAARKLCQHFALDWHLVKMPDDEQTLIDDIYDMLTFVPPTKTNLQTVHPMLYIGPALMADEHRFVLSALSADVLYGSGQHMQRLYRKEGERAFNAARADQIDKIQTGGSTSEYIELALNRWAVYYLDLTNYRALKAFVKTLRYDDLWQGSKKKLPIGAFEDYYRQGAFVRDPRPYQIESGIREWHDTLLKHSINVKRRKAIAALYRDMIGHNAVRP